MARNRIEIAADPQTVWSILSDPPAYGDWVVGSKAVIDWHDDWPAKGSRFRHRVGAGPLTVSDYTEVISAERPSRLVLRAKARPLGVARVELQLAQSGDGTAVTMIEDPEGRWRYLFPPLAHLLVRARNAESLRRLRDLAER